MSGKEKKYEEQMLNREDLFTVLGNIMIFAGIFGNK